MEYKIKLIKSSIQFSIINKFAACLDFIQHAIVDGL